MSRLITPKTALTKLGLTSWTLEDFRERGYPPIVKKPRFVNVGKSPGRPTFRYDSGQLTAIAAHRRAAGEIPSDLIPVSQAVKRFRFTKESIRKWCKQCIFLDRPLKHERRDTLQGRIVVKDLLLVSRSDLETIERMLKDPRGWKLPGNDGVWREKGIYRKDDGSTWLSAEYLRNVHPGEGVCSLWHHWADAGHPAFPFEENQGRPRSIAPKWPARKIVHGGVMRVIHEDDAQRIVDWRAITNPLSQLPGAKGRWEEDGCFRDSKGKVWVMNKWIQKKHGVSEIFATYWRKRRALQFKRVGRVLSGGGVGRTYVYSLSDVKRILDPPAMGAPTKQGTQELHQFCHEQHEINGKSLSEVMRDWNAFGQPTIKYPNHVRTFCNRYLERLEKDKAKKRKRPKALKFPAK
jgi:hypothetical protein